MVICYHNRLFRVGAYAAFFFMVACQSARHSTLSATEKTTDILSASAPPQFGFGRPATAAEIAALDIDVRPDGTGLPAGSGMVKTGRVIYAARCAGCHGQTGTEGPNAPLVSTPSEKDSSLSAVAKEKTIGNYWPYATTLFDYIRRAMPYNAPGSLHNDEVYSLTAFLLHANGIIDSTAVMTSQSLPLVLMPARARFVPDDRRGGSEVR